MQVPLSTTQQISHLQQLSSSQHQYTVVSQPRQLTQRYLSPPTNPIFTPIKYPTNNNGNAGFPKGVQQLVSSPLAKKTQLPAFFYQKNGRANNKIRKHSENNILFELNHLHFPTKNTDDKPVAPPKQLKERKASCNLDIDNLKNPQAPAFLKKKKNSSSSSGVDSPIPIQRKKLKKKLTMEEQKNYQFGDIIQQTHQENFYDNQFDIPKIKLIRKHSDNDFLKIPSFLSETKRHKGSAFIDKDVLGIQKFKILKELGKGAFGRVVLAMQKQSGFLCAIKIIAKRQVKEGEMVGQLARQLKIQSFVNHPNISKVYGFFTDLTHFYIIMECALDSNLNTLIQKKPQQISQKQAANITQQICLAIDHLHFQSIIHRDLKPDNIILHQGVVKLTDFGWSVKRKGELRNTFCGTPVYLSPQILCGQEYDQSVDVWTIGMTLYQMLYKRNAFGIKKKQDLTNIIGQKVIFSQRNISKAAQNFILRCLQKEGAARASINELLKHQFLKIGKEETLDLQKK